LTAKWFVERSKNMMRRSIAEGINGEVVIVEVVPAMVAWCGGGSRGVPMSLWRLVAEWSIGGGVVGQTQSAFDPEF
jgi:hypothetical protein